MSIEYQQTIDGGYECHQQPIKTVARKVLDEMPYLLGKSHEWETVIQLPQTLAFCKTHGITQGMIYDLCVAWGAFESIARGCRTVRKEKRDGDDVNRIRRGRHIKADFARYWYDMYRITEHWFLVQQQALEWWHEQGWHDPRLCFGNDEHDAEVWHHKNYRHLGERLEFRQLIPLCHDCHEGLVSSSASRPKACPPKVAAIIRQHQKQMGQPIC